jgi:hypothetical protein
LTAIMGLRFGFTVKIIDRMREVKKKSQSYDLLFGFLDVGLSK